MKIKAHRFAFAAAGAASIFYSLCALIMNQWPIQTLKMTAQVFHLESLEIFTPYFDVTLPNFASGISQVFIYSYFIVWVWASLYNLMTQN